MSIFISSGDAEVDDASPDDDRGHLLAWIAFESSPRRASEFETKLAHLKKEKLTKDDEGWLFSFEWDAIQPQRVRIIQPTTFITVKSTSEIKFVAKVFADSFPLPILLEAKLTVGVKTNKMTIEELLPNLNQIMKKALEREKTSTMATLTSTTATRTKGR